MSRINFGVLDEVQVQQSDLMTVAAAAFVTKYVRYSRNDACEHSTPELLYHQLRNLIRLNHQENT